MPTSHNRLTTGRSGQANPWLERDDLRESKAAKKSNIIVVGKDSKEIEKSKHKMNKKTRNLEQEKAKAKEDAAMEISIDNVLTLPSRSLKKVDATMEVDADSDANSEVDAQENAILMKTKQRSNGLKAFEQRDLVALAFAGDNVVQASLSYSYPNTT